MLGGASPIHRQHLKQAVQICITRHIPLGTSIQSICQFTHTACSTRAVTHSKAHTTDHQTSAERKFHPAHAHIGTSRCRSPDPQPSINAKQSPTTGTLDSYPPEVVAAIDTCLAQPRELVDCEAVERIKDVPIYSRYFTDRDCVNRLAQDAVATSRPQRALQVLNIAHHFGCYLKPNHYEGVAYHLAGRSHWALIPLLVTTAKHHCGRASVRLLNWNMRALVEDQRYDQLDHAFEQFANADLPPNRRTFHLMISGHLRNRNLNSAKQYMGMMAVAGIPVDPSTHAIIVSAYRSLGVDPKVHTHAFEGLRDLDGRLSTVVLNNIVQQLLDSRDEKAATRFMLAFDLPGGRGRNPTGSGSTTGLVGEHTPDTLSTRTPIDPPAVKPNAATFSILLRYMAREGKLSRMLKLLDHMKQAGVHPDPSVLAALIRGYLAAGHSREAISIVAVLLSTRSAATAEVFCTMMQVQPLTTLPVDVQGVPLTVQIFNALMSGLLDIMGLRAMRDILRTMRAVGISPDSHTVEILMSFLERAQGTGPRQLIRVLRSFSSPSLRPTIRHIHIILRSILRREKFKVYGCGWDTTAAKYSKKRTYNPKFLEGRILDTAEYYHPTAGLKLPRRLRWFGPILQSVSRQAIQSDRATIALRLKHDAVTSSDMRTSQAVFRNMLDQGLHPTIYHYSTLMDGYAKMGDIRGAKQVLQDALDAGIQPNAIMYTILINGYGRRGKPEEAMQAFRAMIRAGIAPDVPSIDAVAHAYFAVGAYSVARRVLREMWAQVQPFPSELEHADLRTLAITFRSYNSNPEHGRRKLSMRQQRLLHWKMRVIKTEWVRFEQWTESRPLSGGIDRYDGYPHKVE